MLNILSVCLRHTFDGPMAAHGDGKLFGGQLARADVIAPLEVRFSIADLAQGVDQTDRLALGPIGQVNGPFCGQDRSDLADDPTTLTYGPGGGGRRLPIGIGQ